jgi:hypothetical protein
MGDTRSVVGIGLPFTIFFFADVFDVIVCLAVLGTITTGCAALFKRINWS